MNGDRSVLEWITAIAGAWISLSVLLLPAANPALELNAAAQVSHLLVGGAVVVLALAGIFAFRVWEEWILAMLGLWLIASTWALGFSSLVPFVVSDVVVGLFVMGASGWVVFTDNAAA